MLGALLLDDLGVSRGSGLKTNLGGYLNDLRMNFLAASQDAGSKIEVGVLFLSLHTFQVPGSGSRAGSAELTLSSG